MRDELSLFCRRLSTDLIILSGTQRELRQTTDASSSMELEETVDRFSLKRQSNDRHWDDSEKRVKLTEAAVEANVRQASLESAISTSPLKD